MRIFLVLFALLLSGCKASEGDSSGQACWFDVSYKATFVSQWSATNHPDGFPNNARFGVLQGVIHSSDITFWKKGQYASQGIQKVAESEYWYAYSTEVSSAIAAGTALKSIGYPVLTFNQTGTSFTFIPTDSFPLVTVIAKLSPSPDWFMGVSSVNLCEAGTWVTSKSIDLYPLDAGTDSGTDFDSSNLVTSPQGVITQITKGIFANNGVVAPLGVITFVLQQIQAWEQPSGQGDILAGHGQRP